MVVFCSSCCLLLGLLLGGVDGKMERWKETIKDGCFFFWMGGRWWIERNNFVSQEKPPFFIAPQVILWIYPPPSNSHHQDDITFLVGNPYKHSFVTIASWGPGTVDQVVILMAVCFGNREGPAIDEDLPTNEPNEEDKCFSRWWFQIFLIFTPIWGRFQF